MVSRGPRRPLLWLFIVVVVVILTVYTPNGGEVGSAPCGARRKWAMQCQARAPHSSGRDDGGCNESLPCTLSPGRGVVLSNHGASASLNLKK